MDAKVADVGADFLKVFLGQGPGRVKPPRLSLPGVGGSTWGCPPPMGFPWEQHYLFVPSLDPPSPVQPPTLSQLISSTWGESSKFGGEGRQEKDFGVL